VLKEPEQVYTAPQIYKTKLMCYNIRFDQQFAFTNLSRCLSLNTLILSFYYTMSTLRYDLIGAASNRTTMLTDTNIYDNIHKQFEFQKQTLLADKTLTSDEKTYATRFLTENYDRNKVIKNSGTKRICENCNQQCLATLYCEYCIRNYLKENFLNWTSGNEDIDNLIKKCQMESLGPDMIVEWIPYSNLENINYLTKGGFSEIYTADWINGCYYEWDSEKQQLIRSGTFKVILKRLENAESANQSWIEEVCIINNCILNLFI
jgi:hypothetical protein